MKNKYLWMFKNDKGDDPYPLFWADVPPNGYVNKPNFHLRDKVIYWIGDSYDKDNNLIMGEVFAFSKLDLLDYERVLPGLQ